MPVASVWGRVKWGAFKWGEMLPNTTDVRNYTGLTTDEVSDTILTLFIANAIERLNELTNKKWRVGEPGEPGASEAVIFFAAQRAYLRAGMPDKAKNAEVEALSIIKGLLDRTTPGVLTR